MTSYRHSWWSTVLYHHQPLLLIHIGKEGENTLDIAKRGTTVTGRKGEDATYTVIGSRVQLWGLKMQLNYYSVYILITGSTNPISFRAPDYTVPLWEAKISGSFCLGTGCFSSDLPDNRHWEGRDNNGMMVIPSDPALIWDWSKKERLYNPFTF